MNATKTITIRECCNACGGPLDDVFSLGGMPLANGLLTETQLSEPTDSFPLVVTECQSCSLAQLRYVIDPTVLYADYRFYTAASQPNLPYFADLAQWIRQRTPGNRVLEIGSNDGTLLAALESVGFDVAGVDPATQQCVDAQAKLTRGQVICDYWGERVARDIRGLVDVVVCCNVLGHSDDLDDFISGVRRVIRTDGLFVVEVQYLKSMLEAGAFELAYHEHVSYFDEHSLGRLLARNGFKILGWEITDAQSGTLRMWASAMGGGAMPEPAVHDWRKFRVTEQARRTNVMATIDNLQRQGRRICFYGAPAKATQIANYWKLGADTIAFATDTTPAKQGRFIPGALIPVVHPSRLQPNDAAIVAAWNFYPQITQQEAAFTAAGGILICPTLAQVTA